MIKSESANAMRAQRVVIVAMAIPIGRSTHGAIRNMRLVTRIPVTAIRADQKTAIEKKTPWRWCLIHQNQHDANHDSKPRGHAQRPVPRRHGFAYK